MHTETAQFHNEGNASKQVILTGMRPTGALHLGHYAGALENWVRLQNDYKCSFLIADYQALSDHIKDTDMIRRSVKEVTLDWLAVGLNPDTSNFVIQSYIPEHAELTMLMSMLISWNDLSGNPTLKNEMAQQNPSDISAGFVQYPVSQAADILLAKAHLIPVGDDQLPHVELTRRAARRFNRTYGNTFPVPRALVGRIPRLVGIDGQAKMGKSLGNAIFLSDTTETVDAKVKKMYTDKTRLKATDPGDTENNPVFMYHRAFNGDTEEVADLTERYQTGRVGDVEVKEKLSRALNEMLEPIRERRAYYQANPKLVQEALISGTERARLIARATMEEVRDAMRITKYELP